MSRPPRGSDDRCVPEPAVTVSTRRTWWQSYLVLTKARLSALVLGTTAVGYLLAGEAGGSTAVAPLLLTILGTALAAASANAFNQIIESRRDAWMERTCGRPLPAGDLGRGHAALFATLAGAAGVAILAAFVNGLAALLALFTIVVYVTLYTPLKARSTLNTLVGAVCGATPPMIGWVGATGTLDAGAWSLGALLFVWQIPHFLALAWLYRDDYARGRFVMLPVFDRSGQLTCQIVVLTSLMLIPLALSATLLGLAGWVFTAGSVVLGLWMGVRGVKLYRERSNDNARRVFMASLVYLMTILALLVIDRGPLTGPPTVHRLAAASPPAAE